MLHIEYQMVIQMYVFQIFDVLPHPQPLSFPRAGQVSEGNGTPQVENSLLIFIYFKFNFLYFRKLNHLYFNSHLFLFYKCDYRRYSPFGAIRRFIQQFSSGNNGGRTATIEVECIDASKPFHYLRQFQESSTIAVRLPTIAYKKHKFVVSSVTNGSTRRSRCRSKNIGLE